MSDLVKRLRLYGKAGESPSMVSDYSEDLALLAAAEITALRARLEAVEKDLGLADDQRREWEHHCKTAEARATALVKDIENIDANLRIFLQRTPQQMMLPETVEYLREMIRAALAAFDTTGGNADG